MVSNLNFNNTVLALTTVAAAAEAAKVTYKLFNNNNFSLFKKDIRDIANNSLRTLMNTVGLFSVCNVVSSNAVSPIAKIATVAFFGSVLVSKTNNLEGAKDTIVNGCKNLDAPLALKGLSSIVSAIIPALTSMSTLKPMLQR